MNPTRISSLVVLTLAVVAMLVAPMWATVASKERVTFVNATNTTLTAPKMGGTVFLTNATGNHTVAIVNVSNMAPGARLRVIEVCGKIGSTGNWTVTSVSNVNGAANYSLNNVTYQGVEFQAFAVNPSATTGSGYVAHALAKACYNP